MGCNCGCTEDKFDHISYLNRYADLRNANIIKKCDAYKHYKTYGKKEHRITNLNFDYNYYRNKYNDLKFFPNHQLWVHFNQFGEKENRNYRILS